MCRTSIHYRAFPRFFTVGHALAFEVVKTLIIFSIVKLTLSLPFGVTNCDCDKASLAFARFAQNIFTKMHFLSCLQSASTVVIGYEFSSLIPLELKTMHGHGHILFNSFEHKNMLHIHIKSWNEFIRSKMA